VLPSSSPPSSAARLLAIDCSTERLCLALQGPQGVLTVDEEGGAKASARLLPQVLALLAESGQTLAQLDAIAFAQGPGAFTGLRTACAVAQGLAFGAEKPVLALDSLLLVAEDARLQGADTPLWVTMDARMDEVYAGAYRFEQGAWQIDRAPALYGLADLQAVWSLAPPTTVAGSALTAFGDRLPAGTAQRWPQEQQRALALMQLAQWQWQAGALLDAAAALPLYLRDKVALTTAERLAAKA
jgi:tRNA threonylcarbamoyladenosine biosynthesis protein TsaB